MVKGQDERERDKDESLTREEEARRSRETEREGDTSAVTLIKTSRHAWMGTVWAERMGEGGGVGSVGDGGGMLSPRGQPSSPLHLHP
ncbi:hypothetical protein CesoFtcFv8_009822 [Champsocephalus esox]|uniref:Uncharacterized protein n=1 Tax=Champsocephalus esox TaxID=159716 RepID=A0AAN8C437_9TELE|nr:hypothetical protein CesoFtcFv8_009822 [Champsocephalus esox]